MGRLDVPRSVRRAGLHGREDVHQPGMITALGEDLLDAHFLAERLELADELDLQSRLGGDSLGVLPQIFAQGLGLAGKVEQADPMVVKETGHYPGMADFGQGGGNHDSVKARECTADAALVGFDKRIHRRSLYRTGSTRNDRRSSLFGSVNAGLGLKHGWERTLNGLSKKVRPRS
jgi:hypothetical protein